MSFKLYKRFFIECDLGDRTLKEILKHILIEDKPLTDIKFSFPSKKEWSYKYYTSNEISENYLVINTIRDHEHQEIFVKYEKGKGITIEIQIGNMAYFYITIYMFGICALILSDSERNTEYTLFLFFLFIMIGFYMILPFLNADSISDDIKTQLHIAGIKYHPQIGNLK